MLMLLSLVVIVAVDVRLIRTDIVVIFVRCSATKHAVDADAVRKGTRTGAVLLSTG